MADVGVHDHIENNGGQGVALRYTLVPLEWASEVPAGLGHHGNSVPVRLKKSNRPENYPVHCEKFQVPFPVLGVIGFPEIQKYLEEDRLPHGCKLLDQLGLEGGCPCPPSYPKPVERIVK